MNYGDIIKQEIDKGLNGGISTIPLCYPKLGEHIVVGKQLYTLIGGNSGNNKKV